MEVLYYAVIALAWTVGGFISGVTSMGCSLIAMPVLTLVMSPDRAILISCVCGGVIPALLGPAASPGHYPQGTAASAGSQPARKRRRSADFRTGSRRMAEHRARLRAGRLCDLAGARRRSGAAASQVRAGFPAGGFSRRGGQRADRHARFSPGRLCHAAHVVEGEHAVHAERLFCAQRTADDFNPVESRPVFPVDPV